MIIHRTARDPKIDKAEQESAIICLLGKAGREAEEPAEGLTAQSPSTTSVGRLVHREPYLVGPLGASAESPLSLSTNLNPQRWAAICTDILPHKQIPLNTSLGFVFSLLLCLGEGDV